MVGEQRPPSESQLPGLPGYHRYNAQPWLVSVATCATILGFVSVVLRLLSRRINAQPWWWDDWMILFSGAWSLVALGLLFSMRSCGLGLHVDVVDPQRTIMMLQRLVAAETLYAWSLSWTKLSVLLMYYRVFRVKHFKVTAYAVGTLVMSWAVCITFLFVFTCVPVEKLWLPDLPGRCISQMGTWLSNAASTVVTDLIIVLLPAPHIWRLHARKPVKIGLYLSFGLGGFVVFVSSYRVSVLLTYTTTDPTYTLTPTVGWTAIEISMGIVSANLPTMLPVVALISRWLKIPSLIHTLGSTRESTKNHYDPSNHMPAENASPGHGFCKIQDKTNQGRKSRGLASRSTTPALYIYEEHSWDMENRQIIGKNYSFQEQDGSKSGESILLRDMKLEEEQQHKFHRPS